MPKLRGFAPATLLRNAFAAGCRKPGFRICQFSVQRNHVHMICEASDRLALARGIQGWSTRVARRLNKKWGRSGKLFADRYHAEILTSPRQVKNALVYVLQNARKHGEAVPAGGPDPLSSSWYFDGWRDTDWKKGLPRPFPDDPLPVARARTWLLSTGWLEKWGPIGVDDMPAARS